jgi:predicted metal-dependent hydrolase
MVLKYRDSYIIDINDNNLEDWGYFIDIDEYYENKMNKQKQIIDTKKEGEYDKKNNILPTESSFNYFKKKHGNISSGTNMLIRISSTGLASILLTYLILCVI